MQIQTKYCSGIAFGACSGTKLNFGTRCGGAVMSLDVGIYTDPGAGAGPDEALKFSRELKMPIVPSNLPQEMSLYIKQLEQVLQSLSRQVHDAVGKLDGRFLNIDGSNTNQKIDLGETYIETKATIAAGMLKFGTFSDKADTPVIGYIKIRDKDNVLRRIAVIE